MRVFLFVLCNLIFSFQRFICRSQLNGTAISFALCAFQFGKGFCFHDDDDDDDFDLIWKKILIWWRWWWRWCDDDDYEESCREKSLPAGSKLALFPLDKTELGYEGFSLSQKSVKAGQIIWRGGSFNQIFCTMTKTSAITLTKRQTQRQHTR